MRLFKIALHLRQGLIYTYISCFAPWPAMFRLFQLRILALILLSAATFILALPVKAQEQVMEFRYWDWGNTPKRDNFQYELLKLALDLSTDKFGPYSIEKIRQDYTTQRVRREINIGTTVNVRVGPWRPNAFKTDLADEINQSVDIPILANLLGYRQLIVHKDNLDKFSKFKDKHALRRMHAGLGRGWQDVQIFRTNGYPVNDTADLPKLVNMLAKKRFDYLPLSVMETKTTLERYSEEAETLGIVPKILFYYPLPIVFYTNINQPELAERIHYGLEIAKKNGSSLALLNEYFINEISTILDQDTKIITLNNQFIPEYIDKSSTLIPTPKP